ncbi:c-type cytochrome [Roseibium aestuarii]|uniref:C-type cytochrome n=1 Tax=Roseibium aestuarii TaxID=2600299 RepID=A0ABW4JX95_9HYPH|nr:cytochrome c [Roseibium aestuarii]
MVRTIAASTLALALLGAVAAQAAGDPVATRKAIMQSVAGAAGLSGAMMKGEVAYSPAAGKAAISSFNAAGHTFGDYFPEGSQAGDTTAAAKIWEDRAGFEAAVAKLADAAGAAMQASGKDGPADVEAFKAAVGPVLGTCRDCHQVYRTR